MIKTSPSDLEDSGTFRSGIGLAREAEEEASDLESEKLRARLRSKMFGVEALPVKVGRFAVLGTLGRGGMGIVYAAYDDELDRKVAVKLLHRARADQTERERLLREAQALAKLSHPNVVQVYEAGTHNGRVFVAMEYVGGPTLRTWSDERKRSWREVIAMYLQAGLGLSAAHKAGIIHRDFKPGNLLLGDDDRVRVVDFGLARASGAIIERPASSESNQDLALTKELTQTGEVMGTPAYMSPEHVSMRKADARSDQFSFCVALYEALFGRRPHQADGTAELLIAIADGDIKEPPRVSGVPRRITRAVMRGLSTDPADRFESIDALLEAIEPRPARTGFALGGAGLVVGAIVAGYVVASPDRCADLGAQLEGVWDDATSQATSEAFAGTQLPFAGKAWDATRAELDSYAQAWTTARTEACEATRARHGSDRLGDLRVACLDRRKQKLAALTRLLADADAETVSHSHEAAANLPRVQFCADLELLRLGIQPPRPADAVQVGIVRGKIDHAGSLNAAGRFQEALGIAEQAVAHARDVEYDPALAEALYEVGRAHEELNGAAPAAEALLEAADLAEASRHDQLAADVWTRLVLVRGFTGSDLESALAASRRADSAILRIEDDPLRRAALWVNLGRVHLYREDRAAAQDALRKALVGQERELGPEHPNVLLTKARLAEALIGEGAGDEALRLHQAVLERLETDLGQEHPRSAGQHVTFGYTLATLGRFDDARSHYDRAVPVYQAAYGRDSLRVADLQVAYAVLEVASGRIPEGLERVNEALRIQDAQLPREHRDRANTLGLLGELHQRAGHVEKALEAYGEYISISDNQPNLDDAERRALLAILINTGLSSAEMKRCEEARKYFDKALEHIDALGEGHRLQRAVPLYGIGECDLDEGNLEAAQKNLQESLSIADGERSLLRTVVGVRRALSRLARAKGDHRRAAELAQRADQDLATLDAQDLAAHRQLFKEGE